MLDVDRPVATQEEANPSYLLVANQEALGRPQRTQPELPGTNQALRQNLPSKTETARPAQTFARWPLSPRLAPSTSQRDTTRVVTGSGTAQALAGGAPIQA